MAYNLDKTPPPMLLLTQSEADILAAAEHVKYGELLQVSIAQAGKPTVQRAVTASQAAFITAVREQGLTYLDAIIVHNGVPQQIEIDGKHGTIQYKRKLRFN